MPRSREARRRDGNEAEFSRIVAFSDGVFAIAITLLVLTFHVPAQLHGESLAEALWGQRHNLLAYAISFAVIGRYWTIHHRFFADVVGFDGRLLGLNIFYLAWIVLIPFTSEVLGDHGGETAVILYAVNLAAVSLVGMLMMADARAAGLAEIGAADARRHRARSLFVAAVFLASVPVAFFVGEWTLLLWLALFFDPGGRLGGQLRAGRG